jgi:hypothetical protein
MLYEERKDFAKAINILKKIDAVYAGQRGMEGLSQEINGKIAQLQATFALQKKSSHDTVTVQ